MCLTVIQAWATLVLKATAQIGTAYLISNWLDTLSNSIQVNKLLTVSHHSLSTMHLALKTSASISMVWLSVSYPYYSPSRALVFPLSCLFLPRPKDKRDAQLTTLQR